MLIGKLISGKYTDTIREHTVFFLFKHVARLEQDPALSPILSKMYLFIQKSIVLNSRINPHIGAYFLFNRMRYLKFVETLNHQIRRLFSALDDFLLFAREKGGISEQQETLEHLTKFMDSKGKDFKHAQALELAAPIFLQTQNEGFVRIYNDSVDV